MLSIDPKIFPAFIDESMHQLPGLRSALILHAQSSASKPDLQFALSVVRSLASSAEMLGLEELHGLSLNIEGRITAVANGSGPGEAIAALDLLSKLEATLLKASMDDENFSLDIDDFLDESFEVFHPTSPAPLFLNEVVPENPSDLIAPVAEVELLTRSEPELASEEDAFEIDPELLEIFAEEAEELLSNIETSLGTLSEDPNDSNALWEIRRNAHTFKGSAGIVGLKQLSKVAHRIEDLLDRLAESNRTSSSRIITVLQGSTSCLRSLTSGDDSPVLHREIEMLFSAFDGIVASLDEPEAIELPDTENVTSTSAGIIVPLTVINESEDAASAVPAEKVFAVLAPEGPKAPESKAVVRVSLTRLDELMTVVRDIVVGRSTFEQHLRNLDRQIQELHNTTRRLQTSSTKLEVDFDAAFTASGNSSRFDSTPKNTFLTNAGGFDELEFDQYTDFHETTRELAETSTDTFAIGTELDLLRTNFESVFDEQRRLVEDLQERLMRLRMVEFGSLANRLQRAVRVTCDEEEKKALIHFENEKLPIDTQLLDALIEPLIHLLKNAVVHGIEDPDTRRLIGKPEHGVIEVGVRNEQTHILVTVKDDGRGVAASSLKNKAVAAGHITAEQAEALTEEEAFELMFLTGLTTAEKLNLSAGRGVGMSIVKESIAACRGTISIESSINSGTKFSIRIPLTLAITESLLVRAGVQTYAIPRSQLRFVFPLDPEIGKGETVSLHGVDMDLVDVGSLLNEPPHPETQRTAVVAEVNGRQIAFVVNEVLRTEEIVIKPLGRPFGNVRGILGAAILGSGELVTVVDLPELLKRRPAQRLIASNEPPPLAPVAATILIVDDSPSVRHMTSKVIKGAGWQILTAKDGLDAMEQLKSADTLPAVILSDIEMPRMNGYEFVAALQEYENFAKIPVIMITSRNADKHRDKAFETGIAEYLTKPYEDRELIAKVRELGGIT